MLRPRRPTEKKPCSFPSQRNCGLDSWRRWWSRLFFPDQKTGHAAHVTYIVAEPSYRSLLTAATAWPDRVVDECLAHYLMALLRAKLVARNEMTVHFPSDAPGPMAAGARRHSTAGTNQAGRPRFYHSGGALLLPARDVYLGMSSAPRKSQSPASRLVVAINYHNKKTQGPKGGDCPKKSRTHLGMWQAADHRCHLASAGGRYDGQGTSDWLVA